MAFLAAAPLAPFLGGGGGDELSSSLSFSLSSSDISLGFAFTAPFLATGTFLALDLAGSGADLIALPPLVDLILDVYFTGASSDSSSSSSSSSS
jgi:hypothetical protein